MDSVFRKYVPDTNFSEIKNHRKRDAAPIASMTIMTARSRRRGQMARR
jgi:hypothetical protein